MMDDYERFSDDEERAYRSSCSDADNDRNFRDGQFRVPEESDSYTPRHIANILEIRSITAKYEPGQELYDWYYDGWQFLENLIKTLES